MDDDIVIISTTKTNASNKKESQGNNGPSDEFNIVITDISQENRYSNERINYMAISSNNKEINKANTETSIANLPTTSNSKTQSPSFPEKFNAKIYDLKEVSSIPNETNENKTLSTNEINNSQNEDNMCLNERESTGYFSYFKNLFTKSSTQTNADELLPNDENLPQSKRYKYSTDNNQQTNILDEKSASNNSLNTELKASTEMNISNTLLPNEEQSLIKDVITDEREISIEDQVDMYYTDFSNGKGPLNLMSSLLGKDIIQETIEIPTSEYPEDTLNESNINVSNIETNKQEIEKKEEESINNNETLNKIKIILKNRTQCTTFHLSETENLKPIFDSVILGDKKIFFGEFVISKFSTPKILQMSNTEANILQIKNPKIEQNGLLLKINVSSSKCLEQTFPETVKLKDIFNFVTKQGISGKKKLVFNGMLLKEEDLMDLDDGYCIDAV